VEAARRRGACGGGAVSERLTWRRLVRCRGGHGGGACDGSRGAGAQVCDGEMIVARVRV
jgi:hypothetical protein